MGAIYRSRRIGKGGVPFDLYKFRTLRPTQGQFAQKEDYLPMGRFLRKLKLDELPQLMNWIKGDIRIFGYRPEEERTWNVLSPQMREILEKQKPGIIDLSSVHFFDEEKLMQIGDPFQTYWEKIRPLKFSLQAFYMENKCFLLNLAILWIYLKKSLWSIIKN